MSVTQHRRRGRNRLGGLRNHQPVQLPHCTIGEQRYIFMIYKLCKNGSTPIAEILHGGG